MPFASKKNYQSKKEDFNLEIRSPGTLCFGYFEVPPTGNSLKWNTAPSVEQAPVLSFSLVRIKKARNVISTKSNKKGLKQS